MRRPLHRAAIQRRGKHPLNALRPDIGQHGRTLLTPHPPQFRAFTLDPRILDA